MENRYFDKFSDWNRRTVKNKVMSRLNFGKFKNVTTHFNAMYDICKQTGNVFISNHSLSVRTDGVIKKTMDRFVDRLN